MTTPTKKCPQCAEQIQQTAAVCPYCDAKFEVTARGYCTNCHALRDADESGKCRVCGTPVADLRVTSRFVGEEAPAPAGPTTGDQRPTLEAAAQSARKMPGWAWALIGVAIIALLGGGAVWLGAPQVASLFATATRVPTITPPPSATPRPKPTATPAPAWISDFAEPIRVALSGQPPDFQDDFQDAGASRSRWSTRDSGVTFAEGVMRISATGTGAWQGAMVPLNTLDFALEFEFVPKTFMGEDSAVAVLREQEDGWYDLSFMPGADKWGIGESVHGNWVMPLESTTEALKKDSANKVLIIVRGGEFAVYLNGAPLTPFYDTALLEGDTQTLGVWAVDGTAEFDFDNVKAWDLDHVPGLPPTRYLASLSFYGQWKAVDPEDGSNMQLKIASGAPNGIYDLTWTDDYWNTCEGPDGIGTGTAVGDRDNPNVLYAHWIIECPSLGTELPLFSPLTYDWTSNTITQTFDDGSSYRWERASP